MILKIKIEGLDKLKSALKAVADDAARTNIATAQASVLRQIAEANFRSERLRPAPWAPLSAATLKGFAGKRKKRKGAARPLIDTGTLARSLSVQDATPDGAGLASTQHYAGYHQFGSTRRPGHPPARPFVPVTGDYGGELTPTSEAEKRMLKAGEDALRESARRAGFKMQ